MSCYFFFVLLPMDLSCGECNVISFYFMCFSVDGSVCLVCCVSDSACELFSVTICYIFKYDYYLVVECYGSVEYG